MSRLDSAARLAALKRSGLLNRDADERFASLVYATASLITADACMVNALTAEQNFYVGFWPPELNPVVRPISESGCVLTVESTDTVAVTDVSVHPFLCTMPWVTIFRGFLSTPVVFDDQVVGALCALSKDPREWSIHDIRGIEAMADLVSAALAGA